MNSIIKINRHIEVTMKSDYVIHYIQETHMQ